MNPPPMDNKTGFAAHPQVLLDKDGEKVVVIVKATFEAPHDASAPLERAPKDRRRGIRLADVPWDIKKPEKSACDSMTTLSPRVRAAANTRVYTSTSAARSNPTFV